MILLKKYLSVNLYLIAGNHVRNKPKSVRLLERGLKQELIEQIKERNDIVMVISEYVSLRRSGRSLVGLCPFHGEKTPSFNVNQEKQLFYCFGCGVGGNVFNFIMRLENLDFIGAAKVLAERAGIAWPEYSRDPAADTRKDSLFKINKLAMAFFNQYLVKTEAGERGRNYFNQRGITPQTVQLFNLGYAPAGWHGLTDILRKKQVTLEEAEKLGLLSLGEGGFYDRFRDRLMFPISDPRGNIVGFGGRVFDDSQPKYLNSPETEIFHKGHYLFGLALAKEEIRKKKHAIVVEGYLDVIQAHQAGFNQTVASLGTALTKEQARMLKKYTSDVILAYDGDAAGVKATERGMILLQEAGLKVRILDLPSGEDPDSYIKKNGAAAFEQLLNNAISLTDFQLRRVLKEFDLNSPQGKVQALEAVLPEIAGIDNRITQEFYLRLVSREIGTSEVAVFSGFDEWLKKSRKKSPVLDRERNNSYTKDNSEKIGTTMGTINLNELPPLKRAIFQTEKELLQFALQEYDKFKRIKEELKLEEFSFAIWRDLLLEIERVEASSKDSQIILAEIQGPFQQVAASLIAEHEVKASQVDLEGSFQRLQMLHLQELVQNLTNQLTTGKDEHGLILSETDLKIKAKEFTEVKRRLQKQYPQFSTGI
ncbi:MAG TPA: DNA primase [Firmicutes bacterium]|nr:DNA primase [Bacillota bacterium]